MTGILKTKRFIVRPFTWEDLKTFTSYRAIPSVAQFQSWQDYTYDDAVALYKNMDYANFPVQGRWYQLAIADRHSDTIVGDLAVYFTDDHQAEIGFTVAPAFQQSGAAFEAVNGLLDYLFLVLKKHRVIAVTDIRNIPSCRLLEKTGFRQEAHYVKNIFFKGSWGDEYLYAMLDEDYRQSTESKI